MPWSSGTKLRRTQLLPRALIERIIAATASALDDLLARGGVSGATVEATTGERHELERPEDFWDIVLGSGYRATVDALGDDQRERLRKRVVGELGVRRVTRLRNDVVFATSVKR